MIPPISEATPTAATTPPNTWPPDGKVARGSLLEAMKKTAPAPRATPPPTSKAAPTGSISGSGGAACDEGVRMGPGAGLPLAVGGRAVALAFEGSEKLVRTSWKDRSVLGGT